jgi:hypothetical protein
MRIEISEPSRKEATFTRINQQTRPEARADNGCCLCWTFALLLLAAAATIAIATKGTGSPNPNPKKGIG